MLPSQAQWEVLTQETDMLRRHFLTTVAALSLALISPLASLAGFKRKAKLVINGIELDLPKKLDISLEIPPEGVDMGAIKLHISGGQLRVICEDETALVVDSSSGGGIDLAGWPEAVRVTNTDQHKTPTILLRCSRRFGLPMWGPFAPPPIDGYINFPNRVSPESAPSSGAV